MDDQDGYIIINPLYCFDGGRNSWKKIIGEEKDSITTERAAVIVNRGWVPAYLKDKRRRPNELNSRQLVKIRGVFRPGKNIHNYKHPNNPDNNEWHNLSLEDIGLFFDLPNYDEQKYYYFQAMDLNNPDDEFVNKQRENGVHTYTKDNTIEDFYGWRWNERTHGLIEKSFGLAAAGCLTLWWWA